MYMMDKGKKPMVSSQYNMFSNGSSESSDSSLKRDVYIRDENEDAEEDEVFWNPVDRSSNTLDENHKNDMDTMVSPLLDMGEQSSARSTIRAKPIRPFRKAMPPDVLAKLSIQDPKRARRIITNRMSAVRAKEKKKLYTYTLEHQIHTLRAQSAASNANLTLIQAENLSLDSENAMLKDETSRILQQIRFQDSLNDGIRNEIQELRMLVEINGNHHHQQAGMMPNYTGNSSGLYNNINNPATAQFLPPNSQNYQAYHQVEQIQNGFEHLDIGQGQQYYQALPVDQAIQHPNHTQINPFAYQQQQHGRN